MARMLAEPLTSSPEISEIALAWLVFATLLACLAAGVPFIAWLLRRWLPDRERASIPLEPVAFGFSQKVRRSPRQPVLQHRTLMAAAFIGLLGLLVLPVLPVLEVLGVGAVQVTMAVVLPTLVVALHARQRDANR